MNKIEINCEPRYWEDAIVNGIEDVNGDLIPGREGDSWCITFDHETGVIDNWPQGTTADIHYKVCDAGTYTVYGKDRNVIRRDYGYVPPYVPNKWGDYIIFNIDETGKIVNYHPGNFDY